MLTREYLVHSWTSYLDVFPIGLSLISRPKKCNTMHKRNLPFRTVKAGGGKKREEVDSIVSCFPQISVLKPERCQSGLVSHIHQDQQTFAGYTVYFILNSQWNPVDSPFFPSWSRLMSQFTAHWSSIPPPAAGDLLWVSETYERDGGRCVAQLSTKSKTPDMQQQLRTECSTRLWSSSWTTLLSGHPLHSSLWHEYIVDMPVWICWTRSCVMEQLETSKRNLKLSQMFNYKKKGFLALCVIHKKLKNPLFKSKSECPFQRNTRKIV